MEKGDSNVRAATNSTSSTSLNSYHSAKSTLSTENRNSTSPLGKSESTTTITNSASVTEGILSTSSVIANSNTAPSTSIFNAIPSTSIGLTHSLTNEKTKAERCFVRCLRRIGDNHNTNRHLILETGKSYWVGRADENQLSLPYGTLSRKHAEIKEEADGRWTVMDNKSSNGTVVHQSRPPLTPLRNLLMPMQPFRLADRDFIQFGPDETQDMRTVRYMFHKALKFSRHPSIPVTAMVNADGEPSSSSLKRGLSETDQSAAKRPRPGSFALRVGEEEEEILGYRKQMKELEERLRRQDEEMEEAKKSAADEQKKLAEKEALVRERMKEQGEQLKAEIAENLRRQNLEKEASHAEEMERVRRDFEEDKAKLEAELLKSAADSKEEMAKMMAEKEKELADKLAASAAKLEEEKMAMEEKMKAELREKEEEEKRVMEEIEEGRRALIQDRQKLEKEAEEKRKALETELINQRRNAETEKENHQKEMKEAYVAELKGREAKIREQLDRQKKKLEEEKKVVEERLQVEMNEMLEEKDKTLRDELIKERDRITNEIQMRQAKEAQLETEIASLNMAQEDTETESKRKILSSLEETMEEELKCSICTELLIEATSLNCSHSFCAYCIKEWRKAKNECPVCRQRITMETRALALDSYIDKMVLHLSEEMQERREENRKFRNEQKQGMHQPQPGLKTCSSATPGDASRITISSDDDDSLSEDSNSDIDSNTSGTISGDPDAPYGGFGSCYVCGHRGHWAPGCPNRW